MKEAELLSISKFAKLVGTTRRTLIFYDQKEIFKPVKIAENGYRYYSYDQIYEIGFILGLRDLGLSVDEIKDYLSDGSSEALNKKLVNLEEKVKNKIENLQQVLAILDQKASRSAELFNVDFNKVKIVYLPTTNFWCSDFKVDCSYEAIGRAYTDFYHALTPKIMANKMVSGFLVDVPQAKPNLYANAGFRIIKEKSSTDHSKFIPEISKKAGEFLLVKVVNTEEGIETGLTALRNYAEKHNLSLGNDMWQFNIEFEIKSLGLTENSILAYRII